MSVSEVMLRRSALEASVFQVRAELQEPQFDEGTSCAAAVARARFDRGASRWWRVVAMLVLSWSPWVTSLTH